MLWFLRRNFSQPESTFSIPDTLYNVWDEVHPMLMTIRSFLPGLASFGPMVFETKMEIWRVYGRRRTQRDDDISHNLVGRWTKNKLSGGVKQRTFHIHTCRIDWKTPKRYKNHVSDLILMYMYWLSIHAIKSISYRIKHDNKYLVSESRSSMMLYLAMELFIIEVNPTVILSYILYSLSK